MGEGTKTNARKVPKIYAHRGASSDFPEHTRDAYEAAVIQGADGFECDVRLTKDDVAILWHDADMARITDSKFLGTIAELTYDEVRLHYSKAMKLSEFLDIAIENKKDVAIETKHPVPTGHKIESEVARLLNTRALQISAAGIRVSVMSFSWFALEFFKRQKVEVEVTTVMLLNRFGSRLFQRFTSAVALGPGIGLLKSSPAPFRVAQKSGFHLFIWTVDETAEMRYCADEGVDVVITNKPELARKVLGYP